jgi:hypothetical protein
VSGPRDVVGDFPQPRRLAEHKVCVGKFEVKKLSKDLFAPSLSQVVSSGRYRGQIKGKKQMGSVSLASYCQ